MLVGRTGRQQRRPRAGTALRTGAFGFARKNILFSGGCACNPRGRPAKPKPRRPSVLCASNEYPRAENPRVAGRRARIMPAHKKRCCGEQMTAYTRVVLRMRGRFFNLSFRQPPMRGGGAPPFLWASKGLAPDLDRRLLPCRTGRQDGRFLKRLGRLFSGIGALFLNRNGREAVLALPLPLAKTDRTVDGGA